MEPSSTLFPEEGQALYILLQSVSPNHVNIQWTILHHIKEKKNYINMKNLLSQLHPKKTLYAKRDNLTYC